MFIIAANGNCSSFIASVVSLRNLIRFAHLRASCARTRTGSMNWSGGGGNLKPIFIMSKSCSLCCCTYYVLLSSDKSTKLSHVVHVAWIGPFFLRMPLVF